MSIRIRPMDASDWEAVSRIYLEGIRTNLATFETVCPPYDVWDSAHLAHCRLVIEDAGEVVGWATLSPVSKRSAYSGVAEVSIYMAEKTRGQGLGTRLLQALVNCAESQGIWTLQAGIFQDNTASTRLHEKCGFRLVGYRERISKDQNGTWKNTVLMERRRPEDE